jgi:hypothetical protein
MPSPLQISSGFSAHLRTFDLRGLTPVSTEPAPAADAGDGVDLPGATRDDILFKKDEPTDKETKPAGGEGEGEGPKKEGDKKGAKKPSALPPLVLPSGAPPAPPPSPSNLPPSLLPPNGNIPIPPAPPGLTLPPPPLGIFPWVEFQNDAVWIQLQRPYGEGAKPNMPIKPDKQVLPAD